MGSIEEGTPPPFLVIAGPTASGKTGLALTIARHLDGELVGADSIQVYRGFDIGSAKPTPAMLDGIRHHLIDVADADQPWDAMTYANHADTAIASVRREGRLPIVVGGTGLWLRALLRGLVALPAADHALRARLEEEADRWGTPTLHLRLTRSDPRSAAAIHENDRLRIIRALEVLEQTGLPIGELRARHALGEERHRAVVLVLDPPTDTLAAAIEQRLHDMVQEGLIEETRALIARHGPEARPLRSVGYRQVVEHLSGGVSWLETQRAILKATRVYARRQRNWFRHEPGVHGVLGPELLGETPALDRLGALLGRR